MIDKPTLQKEEIHKYMHEDFREYAACTHSGKRLRFLINGFACYRVTHGNRVLYCGGNIDLAKSIYDKITGEGVA